MFILQIDRCMFEISLKKSEINIIINHYKFKKNIHYSLNFDINCALNLHTFNRPLQHNWPNENRPVSFN